MPTGLGLALPWSLGPDEIKSNTVNIKDLQSGNQRSVARNETEAILKQLLEGNNPS